MTFTSTAAKSADNDMSGDVSTKFSPLPGVDVTSKYLTSGKQTHETVINRLGVDGLKLTVLTGASSKANMFVSTMEYQHESATLTAAVDAVNGPTANVTGTIGNSSVTAGINAEYNANSKAFRKIDLGLHYIADGSEASLVTLNKGSASKFSYSHSAGKGWMIAGEVLYEKDAKKTLGTIGGKYALDRETTLKTKLSSDGQLSASYIQAIRANTTLILSQHMNVTSGNTSPRFGLSLVIE
jgi:maltoporin